jgi:acyl carrier protein
MKELSQNLILLELARSLGQICEHSLEELHAGTVLEDIPGIDSLRLLQAVAHLEHHFRVEIDVIALDDLTSVRDVLNAVLMARQMDGGGRDPEPV